MPRADIAILTVIPEEYEAVIASLSSYGCNTEHDPGSATVPNLFGWVTGDLTGDRGHVYRIVVGIVVKPGPGRMASALSVTYDRYRPQYVLIVGIAGGFPQDGLAKGDVAISGVIYDYEYGKVATDFHPRMDFTYQPDQTLLTSAVSLHARDKSWAGRDRQMRPDGGDAVPKLLQGAIASGAKVVDDATNEFFAAVLNAWPKLLAVEMEGAGAAAAIETAKAARQNVGFLMVRGISDMPKMGDDAQPTSASPEGNKAERDKWKRYAATTAANFTVHWISRAWPLAPTPTRRSGSTAPPEDVDGDDPPGAAQHASIGNVTGSNNTVTITQNQGPSLEDLARLMQAVAPDANAEIDAACAYITAGELGIAIHKLNDLRKKKWDSMSPREKYRVEANIGEALERKGEFREAAKQYIEAKRHQPQEDKARAMEAIAYYYLDDKAKAYVLAGEVIKDHPNCSLAIAIRIRSAPSEVSLANLEESVPEGLREEVEILHALGWRALSSGDVAAAERFAGVARSRHPASVEIKDYHATVIVQIEARARQANQPVNREKLEEAVAGLTEGIAKSRGQKDEARLRYNRAEAYDLLGQTEDAETDFRAAIETDKEEPDIARRFALFLLRHDRADAAIEALRQADKIKQNHTNRLMLAGLLAERKGNGDWEAAIALLHETIPLVPELETRTGMVATLTKLLGLLKRHEEAISYLDGLGDGFLRRGVAGAIRSVALLRAGRKEDALACARQAQQSLGADSPETDRMRVAEALGFAGAKREALAVWKEVLKPDDADVFVCTALGFARECGDDDFILKFCKQLRTAGVRHPYTLELEVVTLEKYRMFDEAVAVMRDYIAGTPSDDLSRVFRVRLSLLGLRLNKPELVETDVAKLPPVETARVEVGAAVAHILRNGPCPELGIEYAYELVRRNFDDPLARQAYVGVVGMGNDEAQFPGPAVVTSGCAVKFKADDTGEQKWVIVEDGIDPRTEREEIGPEHQWAREMAGKAVGTQFYLRRDPIQNRTATIEAICRKYVYRKVEIINGWEDRFPDQEFVRKYTFPTKEDGSPDISLILKALDLKEQQKEEMHALYRDNPISATTFAKFADAGLLESLSHLASEGTLPIRCCRGTTDELGRAEAALSGTGTIVLEPSALATLFFSGHYERLELLQGKIVICESALEEYTELRRKFANSRQGFIGKFKGKYLFRDGDPAERQLQEQRLNTFLTKIRPLVAMRSGESLARLSHERREELIGLFGQPTVEAIAEAAASGAILWTDDIAVAEVAREKAGVEKRVWTQMVFRSVAPPDVYADLTLFLLQWRYFFTRVEPDVVLAACRTGSWDPNAPVLRRIAEWLSMPELMHLGAALVCAHSLRLVWKHASEIGQKEGVARALLRAVLGRQGGRHTVVSIVNNLDAIFEEDKVARGQCESVIRDVLRVEAKPRDRR